MILEYGKIPYVDENTATYFGCNWKEAKTQTPFGQLPILDVGYDVVISQEAAINRYCASLVPSLFLSIRARLRSATVYTLPPRSWLT